MTKRSLFLGGGLAVLGLALVALPSPSATPQEPEDSTVARLEQRIQELEARLQARLAKQQAKSAIAQQRAMEAEASARTLAQQAQELERVEEFPGDDQDAAHVLLGDGSGTWLGVETQEITSDKAKELKLPAERGVLLQRIVADSPAAKGGLKENDVITEINGQRVEGAAQFRRMIHEIPAGRAAQFTVWRDGRAQTITVTLGKSEERGNIWVQTFPRTFQLPEIQIPDFHNYPGMDWGYELFPGSRPRLGIDAEDLSGQFGNYFGAPDGEGVLVREVNPGSPAEKAGLKAGDVITSLNGERIRSLGDLREKLAAKREDKTVKLGILRNRSEMSVTVELPPPPSKTQHRITHRTNI